MRRQKEGDIVFINKNVEGEGCGVCATALAKGVTIRMGKKGQKDWLLPSFIFWIWKEKRKG